MATGQYIGVNGVARKVTAPYIGVEGVARNVKSGYVGVDGVARLFFAPESGKPAILEVEKVTSDTYEGETTYTAEEFILLDIYPETSNSTVTVTYGGLTKTLNFSGTNAKKVYFGTYNGVTDSVETPSSGTLTIEGGCSSFACGTYQNGTKTINKGYCSCITAVTEWGSIARIVDYAFYGCSNLALDSLPSALTTIGTYAFYNCEKLALTSLPSGVTSIGSYAFYGCSNLALTSLPSGITKIGDYAFYNCNKIALASLPNGLTEIGSRAFAFENIPDAYGTGIAMLCGEITIPSNVTSIKSPAFIFDIQDATPYNRQYLATVRMLATTPPTIPEVTAGSGAIACYVFGSTSYNAALTNKGKTFKIVVPKGCGATYKEATGWRGYADYIVEAS